MTALTPGDAQDLVAAFKRGWERRDPDVILDLFDAGAEYRPDPFAPPLAGENAIRALWNDIAASQANVEFDAERTWAAGSTVLASYHAAYTRRTSGERIRVRGFMTFELNPAGKVERFRGWPTERLVGTDSTLEPAAADSATRTDGGHDFGG
jgi:limonene-1,2-epoxide hydrolase